ncbi:hypothetical protein MRX96_002223 [Rhipicephalus microplus]
MAGRSGMETSRCPADSRTDRLYEPDGVMAATEMGGGTHWQFTRTHFLTNPQRRTPSTPSSSFTALLGAGSYRRCCSIYIAPILANIM